MLIVQNQTVKNRLKKRLILTLQIRICKITAKISDPMSTVKQIIACKFSSRVSKSYTDGVGSSLTMKLGMVSRITISKYRFYESFRRSQRFSVMTTIRIFTGSYNCSCHQGYALHRDGRTCKALGKHM